MMIKEEIWSIPIQRARAFFREQENVTEQMKADNAMLWVQKMNEIQSSVREIIYSEIIYA